MSLGHKVLIDTRSTTERCALYSGEYDTYKIRFLASMMTTNSVFLDVGANIGFYTVPLANTAKTCSGKVFSFEPHPENFRRLLHNIHCNDLDGMVMAFNIGLSNQTGSATLTMREDFVQGSQTGNASIFIDDGADHTFQSVKIELESLDDLFSDKIKRVDLIKVDIEGHEDLFMQGASKTIAAQRPIIMTEVNKEFYRRRGVILYDEIKKVLPKEYGIYVPISKRKFKVTISDHLDTLQSVASFDGCTEVDNAFLIPDEKFSMALQKFTATMNG